MIPYFNFEIINIGPLAIHVWGLFVGLGITVAILLAYRLAVKQKLSQELILDSVLWMLIGALIFARIFHVVAYEPAYYLVNPLDIIKFWRGGASSTGGFLGAFFGLYFFIKRQHLNWRDLLPYFDILALSLWLGWGIGRIGCFLTHQHPGRLTDFFLAVGYPGGSRFDLGLFESLTGFGLFIIYLLLFKYLTKKQSGLVVWYSFISYAVIRFFLDFLRASPQDFIGGDVRYFWFTPAQWGIIVIAVSVIIVIRIRHLWYNIKKF